MGRRNYYKPGSYYLIDDRTGFATPVERMRMEWNGLMVREQSWEVRQPQDFVRGRVDNQSVPIARPRTPPRFIPIAVTSLVYDIGGEIPGGIGSYPIGKFAIGVSYGYSLPPQETPADFTSDFDSDFDSSQYIPTVLVVKDNAGWFNGDVIWVMQNNGVYFRGLIQSQEGTTINMVPPIVQRASAGNAVVNLSAQSRIVASAYEGDVGRYEIGTDPIGRDTLYEVGPQLEPYPDEALQIEPQDFSR